MATAESTALEYILVIKTQKNCDNLQNFFLAFLPRHYLTMSTEEAEAAKLDAELEAAVADVGGTAGDDGEVS